MTEGHARTWMLGIVTTILVLWALKAAAAVTVPVIFALFLALVIAPVERWVREAMPEKLGWLGLIAALLVLMLGLAIFLAGFGVAIWQATTVFPQVQDAMAEGIRESRDLSFMGMTLGDISGRLGDWAMEFVGGLTQGLMSTSGYLVSATIIVIFIVALMLAERGRLARAVAHAFRPESEAEIMEVAEVTAHKLRLFLITRLGVGILNAALYVAWLWLFDMDLLFVWALLTVLLNFIPNIGSVITGLLPVLYALLTKDAGTVLIIGTGLFVIEQVIGNFVDPKVQGQQVALSPVAILLGLLVWGWVLGIAGTLLSTPILIGILVIASHVPGWERAALLLSNQTTLEGLREATQG